MRGDLPARALPLYRDQVSTGRSRVISLAFLACFACLSAGAGCTKGAPPASLLDGGTESPSASSSADAAAALAAPLDAAPPEPAVDELQARAKKLFEAIQKDEPDIALALFFPKDAFVELKDMKDPSAYWDKLVKQYKSHIHYYHRKLGKKASEAEFDTLELNTKQVYVAPKKEFNKTGYNKVGKSKLRYKMKGKSYSFDIATMIDHEGKWYVTHLRK